MKVCKCITLAQFEVLEDVLSEIEETRVYENTNYDRLQELKAMFSYQELRRLQKEEGYEYE